MLPINYDESVFLFIYFFNRDFKNPDTHVTYNNRIYII